MNDYSFQPRPWLRTAITGMRKIFSTVMTYIKGRMSLISMAFVIIIVAVMATRAPKLYVNRMTSITWDAPYAITADVPDTGNQVLDTQFTQFVQDTAAIYRRAPTLAESETLYIRCQGKRVTRGDCLYTFTFTLPQSTAVAFRTDKSGALIGRADFPVQGYAIDVHVQTFVEDPSLPYVVTESYEPERCVLLCREEDTGPYTQRVTIALEDGMLHITSEPME